MFPLPVLVVEHEAQCPPGWFGEWLAEAGCPVDVRRPHRGDPLPEALTEHAGLLVLGGSMDAYADGRHPWLTRVKALFRDAAAREVAALGICLGHQLAAVALGGTVRRSPRGQQMGVVDVGWTPAALGDPLVGPVAAGAPRAVQWNSDVVVESPPGTVVLARTGAGELQAARFASTVWGVQWHPEAGAEIVSAWAEQDRADAARRGVDVDEPLAAVAAARADLRAAWRALATRFAAMAQVPVVPS